MEDRVSRLFNDFDRGAVSRRHLLQALGIAAATASMPRISFAQGSCGGDRAGTPACNTTPMKAPFEPTGWKTVLLDHFKLQVAELDKESAYYQALMGWKVRSNDGKKVVMDIGNIGSVIMRGGLPLPVPTPTPPTPLAALAASAQALATTAAGLAAAEAARGGNGGGAARGGNGGGARGGARGGNGGGRGPAPARRAIWDGFCFGIEPWDTAKVESELKKRGLNPVADHNGKEEFYSFHVKDPDGFDLQISNGNKRNRRTTAANGELNMAPPFESTGWQTVYLDHISFEVSSYKESVAFYKTLLGWTPGGDEGSQDETKINPEIGGLIIRGGNASAPGFTMRSPRSAQMGHISFGIANFDPDKVLEALQKRGLTARVDTGGRGDIHTAQFKSYHTTTPNGFDLQISNVVSAG
jgi:catechol 2,3-dioxygenase-like lactoylglutathione lyase family enzyme